nr:S26 family signal peptidase [Hyphomonas sp. Mor2]
MRYVVSVLAVFVASLSLVSIIWNPQKRLIWNRTASAPIGLYWLNDDPYEKGDWVIVSASSAAAKWAQRQGFVGQDWPLLKRVAAISGDEICRHSASVSINNHAVASAKNHDNRGRELPVWSGCVTLKAHEVFLLNEHPDSLDGRYFGPTQKADLMGRAHKVDLP